MSYYYLGPAILAPGSVVEPGNWGRLLRLYTPQAQPNAWALIKELVYEDIRRQHYAVKPSRLHSVFLCFTEADLQLFRGDSPRPFDMGYEVELVNANAPSHIADWTAMNITPTDNVSTIETRAHSYWQAINPVKRELVTESSIRIVRRL